jgi:hypothetical protein
VRKWLSRQSRNFYAAGFKAVVRWWEKCIKIAEGYVEKEIFCRFEYHIF